MLRRVLIYPVKGLATILWVVSFGLTWLADKIDNWVDREGD